MKTCSPETAHGDEVRVSVSDERLGISPDLHESIFDRFEQVEGGHRRKTGVLGIGLSLIKQLLALHGGRIWVESEAGKGSSFIFAVPLSPDREAAGGETSPTAVQARSDSPWRGRKVLVVDDLADYHQLMKMLMRSAGQIQSAFNGQEALDALGRDHPDFIIMDLRMPFVDGFEAIRRIKQNPETKDIPILGVSAQAMAEDKDNCLQAGADGYIAKPIEFETLRREVRNILP